MNVSKTKRKEIKYTNNIENIKLRSSILTIFQYILLVFVWVFTVNAQSDYYWFIFINFFVLVMIITAAIGVFLAKEEKQRTIRELKFVIITYLVTIYLYTKALNIIMLSFPTNVAPDPSTSVIKNFIYIFGGILKVSVPVAFIIWIIQRIKIYRNGMNAKEAIKKARNTLDE